MRPGERVPRWRACRPSGDALLSPTETEREVPIEATRRPRRQKTVVGWRELVRLPDWGVEGLVAKIDTGARTSALHVEDLEERDGLACFTVIHEDRPRRLESRIVRHSLVRPTTGETQERVVVETCLELAGLACLAEVSLVSRDQMLAPLLIGRRTLGQRFLVDPRRRYLHGRPR